MNLTKHRSFLIPIALGAMLVWAYWFVLSANVEKWSTAEYSHGYFVPLFAGVLLWLRRTQIVGEPLAPSWWGLLPLAIGSGIRIVGAYYYLEYLEALSLLPCLVGLSICAGGKRGLYWSWPSIAFLFFMLPLPYTLEVMLAGPLRRIAVIASTYTLQTLGFSAVAEGNIILMESQPILVAEACSGLSMFLTFFALSTGLTLVVTRPLIDKAFIILSALPIAIVTNLFRIVVTGIAAETVGNNAATVVHNLAGWIIMMPLALGFLAIELAIIDKLFVQPPEIDPTSSAFDNFVPQFVAASGPVPTAAPLGKPEKMAK